jgi:hypothetical protein
MPAVREIGPPVYHGFTAGAVQQGVGHGRQTVVAEQVLVRFGRRCAETRSEKMFAGLEPGFVGTHPATARRRGKTAIATVRQWRRRNRLHR